MTPHTHMNAAQLTAGCPACIERVEEARWHDAPLRYVTWTWRTRDGVEALSTAKVRVPDGVDPWEVDERYPGESVSHLPADLVDAVIESENINDGPEKVEIGDLVHPPSVIKQEGTADMSIVGYWNDQPTSVRKVTGIVPQHDPERDPPAAWWAGFSSPDEDLQGERVAAVQVVLPGVNYGVGVIYLDDRDGSGWAKVTTGRGSPRWPHRGLPQLIDVGGRR